MKYNELFGPLEGEPEILTDEDIAEREQTLKETDEWLRKEAREDFLDRKKGR